MSTKLAIAVASVVAALASPAVASAATALYPDLKTLPPRYLKFDTADVTGGDAGLTGVHNVLRFSNTTWNAGEGPLLVRSHINPSTGRGPAYQRVMNSDGTYTERATGAEMYWHASHQHYHLDHWGAYQLWKASDYDAWIAGGSTGPEATGSKSTSCVIDEEFIKQLPTSSWPGTWGISNCNGSATGDLVEGLSVGWGDTYDYWRADQWIDLGAGGKLDDGDYVLRSVADPDNVIYESAGGSDSNREGRTSNDAIVRFSVRGGQLVDGNPPTGTVMINNVDDSTNTPGVTLKALGRDDVSGVDQFRVSNDNAHWRTFTYDGYDSTPSTVSWNLADPTYGGNSTAGAKTVYVQFHDKAGNWGASETDTITLNPPGTRSAYAQAVAGDAPAAWWRLNENTGATAADQIGGSSGSYFNSPSLGAQSLIPTDQADSAVGFNGTSSFVRAPAASSLNLGTAITLEAWIKPSALPASGQFASILTRPEAYSLQFNGPKLEFTVMQSGARRRVQAPSGAIQIGQTYHVVATYDGTTQRLYVNGAEVANTPLTGAASTGDANVYVGSWDGGQEFFNGVIDDPAIYPTTLSAARVKSHWDAGNGSQAAPPKAPSGLAATAASDTSVGLTWTDNSTDESSFVIERSTDSSFSSPTTIDVANDRTAYTDSGLRAATTYWYRIRSRNAVGFSTYSNVVSATTNATPPTSVPAAPSGLVAAAPSDTRVDLSWTDNSSNETAFVVERSSDSSFSSVQSTTLGPNTTSWSDTARTASTTYWYRVRAVNSIGSSAYSNAASATTKPAPGSFASAVTADAPVSYWRLGETSGTAAADQRGANAGIYAGSPGLGAGSLVPTETDKAVALDGVNDNVRVADSNSLDLTTGITLEAWIKPSLLPAAGSFASVVTKPESYSLQFNGARLEFTVMQNGTRQRLQAPAGAIVAGQTYHVVATYDGTTRRLYLNGTQVASAALTGAATVTGNALTIGSWDGVSELFNGTIDDVALYNQPLGATRVSAHYTAGAGNATPAPPNPPSGLTGAAPSDTRVDLSWADNSSNETGFVVERSTSSAFTSVQSSSLGANATSFSDTGLTANTTYWYRVKATNSAGSSAYSNAVSVTTKPAATGYSAAVTADAPVSYWRLGETSGTAAADRRGANPGTYNGSPGLGAGSLLATDIDKAVAFDGVNDNVRVRDSNSLDLTTGITLEAWIKPNLLPAAGSFQSVVTKPESYSLQFNGPRLEFTVIQNGTRQRLQAPAGAIVAGQTYHVVATYDGTTRRLYLNGTQVASAALTGAATVTPNDLTIGSWDGTAENFTGTIDEAAVYNVPLSAARVSAHYTAGHGTSASATQTATVTTDAAAPAVAPAPAFAASPLIGGGQPAAAPAVRAAKPTAKRAKKPAHHRKRAHQRKHRRSPKRR